MSGDVSSGSVGNSFREEKWVRGLGCTGSRSLASLVMVLLLSLPTLAAQESSRLRSPECAVGTILLIQGEFKPS